MDWLGTASGVPLIATRAVHFAAIATGFGTLLFRVGIAVPVLRTDQAIVTSFRRQSQRVAWASLVLALASGVIWLLLQTISMSGLTVDEAMTSGVLSTILNDTQFGRVSEIRAVLAIMLASCLVCDRLVWADRLALTAAFGLTVSLAWTGHAGSTPGAAGGLHLAADALHLCAAAAWVGSLVPLILLLALVGRGRQGLQFEGLQFEGLQFAKSAAERFSIVGIVSVAALVMSGIVNATILVGSFRAMLGTDYGRILMLKLVIFAVMLVLAAINRLVLTPRLAPEPAGGAGPEALHQLARNSRIEMALGLAVFAAVGLLGTLHPAIHLVK